MDTLDSRTIELAQEYSELVETGKANGGGRATIILLETGISDAELRVIAKGSQEGIPVVAM